MSPMVRVAAQLSDALAKTRAVATAIAIAPEDDALEAIALRELADVEMSLLVAIEILKERNEPQKVPA